ncbi:MAG: hypothetical protein JSR28_20295 [Proteobacteria bacterium]|nr:hypothetical protein [Pseudomonadota bacterium]MDE2412805.1 hypothetical protein [Sphingomonadales bacterium]
MALKLRREWVAGLVVLGLGVAALLVWAWTDAGIEPVRALTAPAVLPEPGR